MIGRLWHFRGFVVGSVKREFQSRYRNSLLGALWTVINPLALILVYTVIFSQVMQSRLPGVSQPYAYSIYLCAGLLTWGLFAEVLGRCQNIFLENANLLKKINFPRFCLPIIAVLSATLNFAIIFGLFLLFLIFSGDWPGLPVTAVLAVLFVQMLLATGLGITIGVLNVFFRDVGQFFNIFVQFWFWFTPVVYPLDILPERVRSVMALNPMYAIINAYHEIFVYGLWPAWGSLMYPFLMSLALCWFALRMFRKHASEMVDEL